MKVLKKKLKTKDGSIKYYYLSVNRHGKNKRISKETYLKQNTNNNNKELYIYKIVLRDEFINAHHLRYDFYDSAIIIASNEKKCRLKAFEELHGDETRRIRDVWLNKKYTNCYKIGTALKETEEGLVLSSFNAG